MEFVVGKHMWANRNVSPTTTPTLPKTLKDSPYCLLPVNSRIGDRGLETRERETICQLMPDG